MFRNVLLDWDFHVDISVPTSDSNKNGDIIATCDSFWLRFEALAIKLKLELLQKNCLFYTYPTEDSNVSILSYKSTLLNVILLEALFELEMVN